VKQADVIEYLRDHPDSGPADIARHFGVHPRAMQTMLARARKAGLVVASGDQTNRGYRLTHDTTPPRAVNREVLPPEPSPRRRDDAIHRLYKVVAALDGAGVAKVDARGRPLAVEERVRLLAEERDAADTRPDDAVRRRAADAIDGLSPAIKVAIRGALGRTPTPDDLLRAVVEAGVEALSDGHAR
jgi:DNA-binding MarR family transcriptional regulator